MTRNDGFRRKSKEDSGVFYTEVQSKGEIMNYTLYYCPVCKKDTEHHEFAPHFINNLEVCDECNVVTERDEQQ